MKKVIVTGGNGQIGSHIIEELIAIDCKVLNIDNLKTGKKYHLGEHKNLESVFEDISNTKLVKNIFEQFKPEIVIHTAASYNEPDNWELDIQTNCLGGCNLIKESVNNSIKRFIYFQTSLCYGEFPIESPITLNHPKYPATNSYSISKTVTEEYLTLSGLDYVTFRLANVIGPRNLSGPVPIFYQRLKEKKKCFVTKSRRDFVFVKDLASVVIKAVNGKGNGAYHFSCGSDVEILELYNKVVDAMKINDYPEPDIRELKEGEVNSILLDPSKTYKDFGNINFTSLDQIVEQAVDYYDEFGVPNTFTHAK